MEGSCIQIAFGTMEIHGIETLIAPDDEGECMGIEMNIWERSKLRDLFSHIICNLYIICIIFYSFFEL